MPRKGLTWQSIGLANLGFGYAINCVIRGYGEDGFTTATITVNAEGVGALFQSHANANMIDAPRG